MTEPAGAQCRAVAHQLPRESGVSLGTKIRRVSGEECLLEEQYHALGNGEMRPWLKEFDDREFG